jgi:hypothetical protein
VKQTRRAAKLAVGGLVRRREIDAATIAQIERAASYTEEQVLGDWFPGELQAGER